MHTHEHKHSLNQISLCLKEATSVQDALQLTPSLIGYARVTEVGTSLIGYARATEVGTNLIGYARATEVGTNL